MNIFWLWIIFDGFEEGLCSGIHINVMLDVLWCILVYKVSRIVSIPLNFTKHKCNWACVEDMFHLHFRSMSLLIIVV